MFIGHYAVALGAKRVSPRTSLGTLTLATSLLDLVWPLFVAVGLERVSIRPGITAFTPLDFEHYPWSHSLLMAIVWGALLGGVYGALSRNRRGAWVVGAVVVSHWVLDWITHRPDLPLYPGSARFGLGLWNHPTWTLVIECAMFLIGLSMYLGVTRARDSLGRWAFSGYVVFLGLLYVMARFGPPPPSVKALVVSALVCWLFVAWAWWADRHRFPRRY